MEHSKYFDTVKYNYDNGFWSLAKVRDAVVMNWITKEEYFEITGKEYLES